MYTVNCEYHIQGDIMDIATCIVIVFSYCIITLKLQYYSALHMHTDIHTDRQTHAHRQTDRQTDTDRHTHTYGHGHTD